MEMKKGGMENIDVEKEEDWQAADWPNMDAAGRKTNIQEDERCRRKRKRRERERIGGEMWRRLGRGEGGGGIAAGLQGPDCLQQGRKDA